MSQWQLLSDKFDALSPREHWLALTVGMVIVLLVGFTYGIEPLFKSSREASREIHSQNLLMDSLKMQREVYSEALSADPDQPLNAQLAQLNARMQEIDITFSKELSELVSPRLMPSLMANVMSLSGNLKLQSMESIAPTNILANSQKSDDTELFQHAVRMTFTGNYEQIQRFLKALEGTHWQVYWRTMQYEVQQHPEAMITLEFYTLSTEREFLRV